MTWPTPARSDLSGAHVAIVGLGVMGGSLARALARSPSRPRISGFSTAPGEVEAAVAAGILDSGARDARSAVAAADLVVYATPLSAVSELMADHRDIWAPGVVVTDVASLKAPLVARARALGIDARYVGSHPMAGSAESGWGASRADLYRDARVWVADDTGTAAARAAVLALWHAVGARTLPCGADEHDRRMVWTSHLPQLVANALAAELERAGLDPGDLGPGGRDATRLAASSEVMWRDILEASEGAAAEALEGMIRRLDAVAGDLSAGRIDEVARLMRQTRAWRRGAEGNR